MERIYLILMLVGLTSAAWSGGAAQAMPAQVLLLRHGEKPDHGPELSDRGWQRAQALPKLFDRPEFSQFGKPAALFAMSPTNAEESEEAGTSVRAIETLKFVSEELHLPINSDYTKKDVPEMVRQILGDARLDNKLVVICWEHNVLTDIAAAFGMDPAPNYPGQKFDRAWRLTLRQGQSPDFVDLPENLLPGDDAQ